MVQQLVHADLLLDSLCDGGGGLWVLCRRQVDLLHGAGFPRGGVDEQLDLGEGSLSQHLHHVPPGDELAHHLDNKMLFDPFSDEVTSPERGSRIRGGPGNHDQVC